MGRIGVTLSGIERSLLNRLNEANAQAAISSLRLATGNRINAPRDDPAGFLVLSSLQSRLSNVRATMRNVTAADSMVTQAQTAMAEIRTQLEDIGVQLLLDADRSDPLSPSQRAEAQAAIDAAITQINALASTSIDGRRLLDGSAGYQVSGRNTAQVANLMVYRTTTSTSANGAASVSVANPAISGRVLQAATQAELVYTGDADNEVTDDASLTIAGDLGSIGISVIAGDSLSSVATQINDQSYATGVAATVDAVAHTLTLSSVHYGSRATVSVVVTADGPFDVSGGNDDGTANGADAVAEINGVTYTGNTPATAAEVRHRENDADHFAADAKIKVTGNDGTSTEITITTANSLQDVAALITAQSGATGVIATVDQNDLVLRSATTGAGSMVSIEVTDGEFDAVANATLSDYGADAVAVGSPMDGNRVAVNQNGFRFDLEFAAGFAGNFNTITLGGDALTFALSDDVGHRATLAIAGLSASQLGGAGGKLSQLATGGSLSLESLHAAGKNSSDALRVLDEALGGLTRADGSVDGFHSAAITSASDLLIDLEEDLGSAIDDVNQIDDNEEAVREAYFQDLAANAVAGLSILRQQRYSIVQMIQHIAGLA